VAQGENVNAAATIVMLVTGLDYHLCRLKYLRDVAKHKKPLPYTPYFNWTFGQALSTKLRKLLIRPNEGRLLTQLIEVTVCRDSIVHPKFYTITHPWNADLTNGRLTARLAPGAELGSKAIQHKMRRRDFTRLLRLPLVPTWVSYVDAVVCILILHRLLNLLESRYGNPYAVVGGITAYRKQTDELFTGWDWSYAHPDDLQDWVKAFYHTLSPQDQDKVKKNLGGHLAPYLSRKYGSPKKPEFLSKPPP